MLIHTLTKKKIYIPQIAIWFTIFLFLNTFATFYSADVTRSKDYQIYYFSLFFIFIYVFNNSDTFQFYFHKILFLLGFLTICYAVLFKFYLSTRFPFLIPNHGYQLVYPYISFLTHHPIGVVCLILLSMTIVNLFFKLTAIRVLAVIIFFTTLLISYLRAAYVALCGSLLILAYKYQKIPLKIFIMISGLILVLFFAFIMVTGPKDDYVPIKKFFIKRIDYVNLYNKTLFSGRDKYFTQALQAIVARPILGFGPNNFVEASRKYTQKDFEISESSHNIFLDFMAENGLIAGVALAYFFIAVAVNGFKFIHRNDSNEMKLFTVYVSLLILFQFSYYFHSHAIFLTFIIVAALLCQQKNYIVDKYRLTLAASILLPFIHLIYRITF